MASLLVLASAVLALLCPLSISRVRGADALSY